MAELTVDLTYGSALYSAAKELGIEEQILEEGSELTDLFEKEQSFTAFLKNPVISVAEKKTVLKNVFEGRICKELLNFLYILIDKGRVRHFSKIIKAYKNLMDKEAGVAYGEIFSAVPLKQEQLEKFKKETSKLLKMDVELENKIDKKLIGGIRIFVDGRIIDGSLRKRLDDMATSFSM